VTLKQSLCLDGKAVEMQSTHERTLMPDYRL
jgi:hypothetical protein